MTRKCECSWRTKTLGDGCAICNPQYLIEIQAYQIKELEEELEEMQSRTCGSCKYMSRGRATMDDMFYCNAGNTLVDAWQEFDDMMNFCCNKWEAKDDS